MSTFDVKDHILDNLKKAIYSIGVEYSKVKLDQSKHPELGDLSCAVAMSLAKKLDKSPIKLAEELKEKINLDNKICSKVTVSNPGFLNFSISSDYIYNELLAISKEGPNYGKNSAYLGQKAQVEFVSANPTGPLTVGHGRQAVLGDVIARILEWHGYEVEREYYYNDAGRQMKLLGESVKARYLQLLGEKVDLPDGGYEGYYIKEIAQGIIDNKNNQLDRETSTNDFRKVAEKAIFSEIKNTLNKIEVHFNNFVNEQRFYNEGSINEVLEKLKEKNFIYEKDGAVWLKTTKFGKEDDTVLIKKTGEPTYRLPDIAYHRDKLEREYDLIIDIFGADHNDTYPDILSSLHAMGYDTDSIKVLIHQFVSLLRDGQKVKMSTRKATFVTLDELIRMVGVDVVRYFFIMRNRQSHLNFDVGLAEKESEENPVYYLQYAHARICNILKHAKETGVVDSASIDLSLIVQDEELNLIKGLMKWPETMFSALESLEPQTIANYLQSVAADFHRFYSAHRVVTENKVLTSSRLYLVSAVKEILACGLQILGISQPNKM
ncbi:MAG: arginine--tRNA ligase [Candidatus Neomarinimicrobiota bacterium]